MKDYFKAWRDFSEEDGSQKDEEGFELLKEYFYSFMPMVNFSNISRGEITPPASSIEEVLQAWCVDDFKVYEEMMQANNISYHVQLPTKEVMNVLNVDPELRYSGGRLERINRRRQIVSTGQIKTPIIIAVGKNGKAAMTWGDKDLIAAFEAGLKDVPVIFEYQTRV